MPQSTDFSWQQANILIADDEPDMREIFAAWLRKLGCAVTEVADGREALEAVARNNFDAIVTDVRMPRVDGIQLVRHIHRSGNYIPVIIFVSGFVDLPLPDAYDLGVEAVLSKPCPRKDLISALRRSIQRRHLVFEPGEGVIPPDPEKVLRQRFPGPLEDSSVALGRGGISLDVEPETSPGSAVRFSLDFAHGALLSLRGWGVVRWCEKIAEHHRAGIELMYLEEGCLESFAGWLERARPGSFIPKGPVARSASRASPFSVP